jgi:hypothetical protein
MAESQDTAEKVLAEKLISLGLDIRVDKSRIEKQLNPTLTALSKKLNQLSEDADLKKGIFGKDFISNKIKDFTGLDTSLLKATKNLVAYGVASKDLNADNKEFYNTLNPIGKALVSVASAWNKRKEAEKQSLAQSKETEAGLANLNEQLDPHATGMQALLASQDILQMNLTGMAQGAEGAAGGIGAIVPAAEGATGAMGTFISISTMGLALVVVAIAAIGKGLYQMFMQAVTARSEFKKFDQMFGGLGSTGIGQGIKSLQHLNREVWGLGLSMEKVNEVVANATAQGLNFSRAIDGQLVSSVLELSGATGVASSEISGLYTELLKTSKITTWSLAEMGNSLVTFNRAVHNTTTLGQVSFATFKEAISSSANALAVASSKGEAFTNKMTKDLTALSGLATTLSLSISELNSKFEEAGSIINAPDSGFRTLLAISGGANINQMLSNQFDKTDAMIKGVRYLQEFNKSFGGNIQLTAQVAEKQLGISKEMAIKMINMRKESIDDMMKAQQDIAGLQTGATRDAYEKVNSDLASMWGRVKTMFTTFFQNAFGGSSGMQRLVSRVENLLSKLKTYMTDAGWIKKLEVVIDKISDWVGDKLSTFIDWIGKTLDNLTDSKGPVQTIFDMVFGLLKAQMFILGKLLGAGIVAAIPILNWFGESQSSAEDNASVTAPGIDTKQQALMDKLSGNNKTVAELNSKYNELNQFNKSDMTYGADASGNVGFMTIAQQQYELEIKKEAAEKEARDTQVAMKNLLQEIAENTRKQNEAKQNNLRANSFPGRYGPIGAEEIADATRYA